MKPRAVLVTSAAALTLGAAHWAARGDMSRDLTGHLLLYGVCFGAYLAALRASRGLSARGLSFAIGLALSWRIALVLAPPLLSDDVYRYVWEGRIQHHGGNPYRWLVRPEVERWAPLRDAAWERVNHKDYTAIYPPLWQLAARGVVSVSDSVTTMKAFLVACEVASWLLLARLLARRGLPRERLLIAAWSPLALVEIAGSGHNEAFGILFLLAGLLALESARPGPAAVAIAAGFMAKLVPGVLAVPWLRRFRPAHAALGLALAALLTWPYASAGRGLVRTVVGYGEHWRFNETLFALLAALMPAGAASIVALGALLVVATLLAWRRVELTRASLAMGCVWLLLMPSVLPWYALWLVPLLTLVEAPGALAFTGSVGLAYLVYPAWLAGGPWQVGWVTRAVEYGLPVAIQALPLLRRSAGENSR